MTRIGLVGGTFDPIHEGHLALARAAIHALALERVLLVPASIPPHRPAPGASAAHRFAMTALAIQADDRLECSDLEVANSGPSYTSLTLDRLQRQGLDPRRVHFVIGADAFRDIASWRDYPALLDRCHFAVISRPDFPVASLPADMPDLADRMTDDVAAPPDPTRVVLIQADTPAISSTDVRQRLATGAPLDGMVPVAVATHIKRHRLYDPDSEQGAS